MISKEEGKTLIEQWLSKRMLRCQVEQTEISVTLRFDQTELLIPLEKNIMTISI